MAFVTYRCYFGKCKSSLIKMKDWEIQKISSCFLISVKRDVELLTCFSLLYHKEVSVISLINSFKFNWHVYVQCVKLLAPGIDGILHKFKNKRLRMSAF